VTDTNGIGITYNNYLFGVRAILIIILAWKLRSKGKDNFMFKNELKWVGIITVLSVVIPPGLSVISPQIPWGYWGGWISGTASWFPSIFRPLKQSYEEENRRKQNNEINLENLRSILNSENGFKSFLEFLVTEFSTENLFCWRDLHEWIKLATITLSNEKNASLNIPAESNVKLYQRAKEIYHQYIDEKTADSLINISANLRQEIQSKIDLGGLKLSSFSDTTTAGVSVLSQVSETSITTSEILTPSPSQFTPTNPIEFIIEVFQKTENNLYDLMDNDSFRRFKNSKNFLQLEEETKKPTPYPIESKVTEVFNNANNTKKESRENTLILERKIESPILILRSIPLEEQDGLLVELDDPSGQYELQ